MGEQVIWEIVEIDKTRNANINTNTDTNTIERNMMRVEKILREILVIDKTRNTLPKKNNTFWMRVIVKLGTGF